MREGTLLGEIVRSWHPAGTTVTPLPNSIEVDSTEDHPILFHHETFPTEFGTILALDRVDRLVQGYPTSDTDPEAPTADTVVVDEPLVEFDMETGEILHYYSLVDMLDPRRIGYNSVAPTPPCSVRNPECKADWVHDNAIIYDSRDDTYIVSLRHQDAVIKVRRATGKLVWILGNHFGWGPEFEPYLLTPVGSPFEWQYHQHAPMVTPEGTLLLFDNGNNRAMPFETDPDTGELVEPIADADNFSRAVEYLIDPENMTVQQVWESNGNAGVDLFTRFISDADWLPETGNVQITFGGVTFCGPRCHHGRRVGSDYRGRSKYPSDNPVRPVHPGGAGRGWVLDVPQRADRRFLRAPRRGPRPGQAESGRARYGGNRAVHGHCLSWLGRLRLSVPGEGPRRRVDGGAGLRERGPLRMDAAFRGEMGNPGQGEERR